MPHFTFYVLAYVAIFLIWLWWMAHCGNRLNEQRRALQAYIHNRADKLEYDELRKAFDAVPFEKHYNRLLFFRSPWKLYGDTLRQAMEKIQ